MGIYWMLFLAIDAGVYFSKYGFWISSISVVGRLIGLLFLVGCLICISSRDFKLFRLESLI